MDCACNSFGSVAVGCLRYGLVYLAWGDFLGRDREDGCAWTARYDCGFYRMNSAYSDTLGHALRWDYAKTAWNLMLNLALD